MGRSTDWVPSLWRDTFEELLSDDNELDYGDTWNFSFNYSQTDEVTQEEQRRGWKISCHNAYGHFRCKSCRRIWPSARVRVLFRYRLRGKKGSVIMRPFGQACRSCQDDEFHLPGFSEKEVELVLLRLFAKIRKNCYGEEDGGGSSVSLNKVRTKPHETDLCEACRMGICSQADE